MSFREAVDSVGTMLLEVGRPLGSMLMKVPGGKFLVELVSSRDSEGLVILILVRRILSESWVTNGSWSVLNGMTGRLSKVPSMTSMPSSSFGIWSNIDGVGLIGLLGGRKVSLPGGGMAPGMPITSFLRGGC